jgi:hypothetical protein
MCTPHVRTSDNVKDSLYEELGYVFDQFPRYDIRILLGVFNAKAGREDIFKPTIGNDSSHKISNYLKITGIIKMCLNQRKPK